MAAAAAKKKMSRPIASHIFQADGESSAPKHPQFTMMPFHNAQERTTENNTHKAQTKAAPSGKMRGIRRRIAARISNQARVSANGSVHPGGTKVKGRSAMAKDWLAPAFIAPA